MYQVTMLLGWPSVRERIDYNILVLVFKCLHNLAPRHLQRLFQGIGTKHSYSLRNSEYSLMVPKPQTEMFRRSFGYRGAVLWNSLPTSLQSACTLDEFKTRLKQYFINIRPGN